MKAGSGLIALLVGMSILWPLALQAQSPESTVALTESARGSSDVITEYRLPPDKLEKSTALYRTRVAMYVLGTLYGLAVLVLVLTLRIGVRLRDIAEQASSRRFVQAIIFAPLLLILIDVLRLPLSIYGHHLQASYGLSVQSWGSWFWDWTKGAAINAAIATVLIWGLYTLLRNFPKRWWFYGWLASIPVMLLLVFIQPMFIDPVFNKFDSLEAKQPQLLPQIERVMQRGGLSIARSRMFEMQASDKVTTYNAYVTGIGASKRVVVWDNTARDLSVPETLFIFGHEQGHYVLQHIWQSLALGTLGLFVAMYLGHRLIGGVLVWWRQRFGIRGPSDWASLPILMLLLNVFSLVSRPIESGVSRYMEHQADIYALEVIHGLVPDSPQVGAHAFQKLGEKGLAYPKPHPLYVFWAFSHPPLGERVAFAAHYRPWDRNEATRFIH